MWHLIRKPQIEQLADGSYVGHYSGEDWSVSGASDAAVIEQHKEEGSVRAHAETSNDRLIEFARRNLTPPSYTGWARHADLFTTAL